jgi:hypothetical protein
VLEKIEAVIYDIKEILVPKGQDSIDEDGR